MTAKCSMCHGSGFVTSQTICDCKKLMEPSTRDWKPVVGEKVLVEAEIVDFVSGCVNIKTMRAMRYGVDVIVPLSSIWPIRKEGE